MSTDTKTESRKREVIAVVGGVSISRFDVAFLSQKIAPDVKIGCSTEVISLEHPGLVEAMRKGLLRSVKLFAGPLAIPVPEPGVTATEFGKHVIAYIERHDLNPSKSPTLSDEQIAAEIERELA